MKHVLIVILFLGGFMMSEAAAQSNCKPADCKPCPPGCCIINCSSSAAANASGSTDALVFTSMLTGIQLDRKDCNMSRKEFKACQQACKNSAAAANATVNCTPAPSFQATAVAAPVKVASNDSSRIRG